MNICARKGLSEMRTHAQILCLRYYSAERHSKNEKLKILFLGRDEFSCAVLKELENAQDVWDELVVATNPDQRTGRRGNQVSVSPLKLQVEGNKDVRLEIIPQTKAEFRRWKLPLPFASYMCDEGTRPPQSHVLITASFGRILTRKHLEHFLPTRRLNVHPSLLPHYRGPAPIQHSIMHGDEKTGVCVIEMLPAAKKNPDKQVSQKTGIDAGDVWARRTVPQPIDAKFHEMRDRLGHEGGQLLVALLRDMVNKREGVPRPQEIDASAVLRAAPMIEQEDGIFDPQKQSAKEAYRRWRAIGHQRPLSSIVQVANGTGPRVRRAVQLHDLQPAASDSDISLPSSPGSVICGALSKDPTIKALFIRCKDGSILAACKIKPEGKPVLDAQAFWNGVQGKGSNARFSVEP